ncbi:MAG TPA: S8 family serine peptidase [Micromonosporaceae bacterium]|nr:S8 family serine peptidase [Micromonosporaceae bacterium]
MLTVVVTLSVAWSLGPAEVAYTQRQPDPPGRPGQPPGRVPQDFGVEPGEVLVQFRPGATGQEVAALHRQQGGQEVDAIPELDVRVVRVPPGQEVAQAAAYGRNPTVRFAEPNRRYRHASHGTNDPDVGRQWQYNSPANDADIDAFEAWHVTTGAASVRIAVLDSGIDLSHEDLKSKVVGAKSFIRGRTSIEDAYGHGTHVAGSAAAVTDNARGVAGTCPACSLLNGKVLGDDGFGADSTVASGIVWATDNGAKVISMSLVNYYASQTVREAVDRAWQRGVVLVAAAGNDGGDYGAYPAAFDHVIAVGATDRNDRRWPSSNYGWWVDVAAPGAEVYSTAPDHANRMFGTGVKYGTLSGTSMATPHAAGVAGLVWAGGRCTTNACVRDRLEDCSDKEVNGTGPDYSGAPVSFWAHGRINANRAVGTAGCS